MKPIYLSSALTALAALMMASCADNKEAQSPGQEEITLTGVIKEAPMTRTQIDIEPTGDGSLGILWSVGDKIGVFGSSTSNSQFSGTFNSAVASGVFSGAMNSEDSPKYAYYPYVNGATDSRSIPVTVSPVQLYTRATSIAANDIKASDKPVRKADGSYGFIFTPMVSILKTTVSFGSSLEAIESTEKLQSIIFRLKVAEGGAGRAWTGGFTLNLQNLASGLAAVEGKTSSSVTLKLTDEEDGGVSVGQRVTAYASIAPTIRKGDVIEIQLVTNVHKVTFEVKAVADFVAGACYDIPLNLDNLKPENNCTVGRVDAKPPVFESFKFEIAKNPSSLLSRTAVLNTSTSSTEVKSAEDFTCDIDKTLNKVSCLIPYLYNFTLAPTFNVPAGVKVYCGGEEQVSGVSTQDFSSPVEYTLVDGTETSTFTVSVTNTGLPVVVLNGGEGGTVKYLDFTVKAKEADWGKADRISIYENGVASLSEAVCGFRLRGNSSQSYDKKPLAIKLDKRASVLGMPDHKRWVLLSPWTDMSLIRNYLAFNIAQTIQNHFINGPEDGSVNGRGLLWNPSGKNVELVINGIHVGNYLLGEQIKIDENRLPINDCYTDVKDDYTKGKRTDAPSISNCGFLLEFDSYFDEIWKFKTTYRTLPVNFKDEFANEMSSTADGYDIYQQVESYINEIEYNLTKGNYSAAYEKLDINSVIDYWFVYELTLNDEIQHPKSTYMYKNGDGKLCAGPVWDFDGQTFTNIDGKGTTVNRDYYHSWSSLLIQRSKSGEGLKYMWYPLLMKDPNFVNRAKARWAEVYPDLKNIANTVVEERREANRLSDRYNRQIWRVGNALGNYWKCGDEDMEFDAVMDNLKYVYNKRLQNLNTTISNLQTWK